MDKDVRDTWEIEPSKLSFLNPVWEDFLTKTVCPKVCKSLGISIGDCPPKMELYKLLLYEKGSQYVCYSPYGFGGAKFDLVFCPTKSPPFYLPSSDLY